MINARHWLDSPCSAAFALARSAALGERLSDEHPALFYAAPLTGSALALGSYQREAFVSRGVVRGTGPLDVVRRQTGGGAVYAGEGVFYFAAALLNASVLMDCPPGRILNRNVRGLLQGFRLLGVPAHYFGRDFVSVATRPGAFIAWDEREDGRVLFEAFISHTHSYVPEPSLVGYPPLSTDPFRGHMPITLSEARATPVDARELFASVVKGYAAAYRLDAAALDASVIAECMATTTSSETHVRNDDGLHWSPPYEESIGFVYAGVRLNGSRKIAEVRLGGDYFQSRLGQHAVEQQLVGCTLDGTEIGRVINDVYANARHVIEGIRHMDSLRAVVLSAAEAASGVAQGTH